MQRISNSRMHLIGNDQLNVVANRVTAGTKGGNLNFNIKDCMGESLHSLRN